jgi:DNA-binding NarL/FixJ family response regulator
VDASRRALESKNLQGSAHSVVRSARVASDPEGVTLLIAHAQQMVSDALRALIEARTDLVVCGDAADGAAALALAAALRPDLAVVDVALPRVSGVEVASRLRQEHGCRSVLTSVSRSGDGIREALASGALGLLEKSSGADELVAALEAARADQRYLAPSLRAEVAEAFDERRTASRLAGLTRRQREVLQLIAAGCSTGEIARRLGIRARTVETHREKLMTRVGVHKAAGLVRYAIRAGLIDA